MFGMFNSQYYGDVTRWFIGIVEQVGGDVPQLGRVRVRIHGIHGPRDELPLADLPYASVMLPATEGGVSGIGRSTGLVQGATVFGIFMDGTNSQLPLVLGSIPKKFNMLGTVKVLFDKSAGLSIGNDLYGLPAAVHICLRILFTITPTGSS
jgi:hypothetical protein